MLIENPDSLKAWLTAIIEPLCDADPSALAKYVIASSKRTRPLVSSVLAWKNKWTYSSREKPRNSPESSSKP
ncbi:Uncharacterized protein FKW44_020428 [Caligus rogercresseyi]|uniref:Uncharacterized protein n=1 Tax=Caligus rogercresseyi TaxID=217165 RepID=A0A7T8GXJ0_CALRO|nr:Uncharacterized protein FKW44_020428 [Caligus rogercresseyi]